jgi:hypothetical protein
MSHRPGETENYALWESYNPRTGSWLSDCKDILLRFLQEVFYLMEPDQGLFHFEPGTQEWETEESETELIISDSGAINTDTVAKRPALIISRGPFAYGNTSLDQLLSHTAVTDKRTHTDLITGSFVINCISRHGLEAEKLALIVAKSIRAYRRQLQKAGFFLIGNLIQTGSESPAGSLVAGDSDEDFINVPVILPVYYEESWTAEPDVAETLDKIVLKANFIATHLDGSLVYSDALDADGNPVVASEGVIVQAWTVEA